MENPIPLEDMMSQAGKNRTQASLGLKVGFDRFCRAIKHHKLDKEFPPLKPSKYVVPSLKLEEIHIAPYYKGTISQAAKILGCEYNTFVKGVKRKNLVHKFKGGAGDTEAIYCCICRKEVVKYKFKMCAPCKRVGAADDEEPNQKVKPLPLPEVTCKVYTPGSKEFKRVAAECTPILEIKNDKKLPFIDRFN